MEQTAEPLSPTSEIETSDEGSKGGSKKRGRPHEQTCVFCYLRHTTCRGCISFRILNNWTPQQLQLYQPVWKKFGSSIFYPSGSRLIKRNRITDVKEFSERLQRATQETLQEVANNSELVATNPPSPVGPSTSPKPARLPVRETETIQHRPPSPPQHALQNNADEQAPKKSKVELPAVQLSEKPKSVPHPSQFEYYSPTRNELLHPARMAPTFLPSAPHLAHPIQPFYNPSSTLEPSRGPSGPLVLPPLASLFSLPMEQPFPFEPKVQQGFPFPRPYFSFKT